MKTFFLTVILLFSTGAFSKTLTIGISSEFDTLNPVLIHSQVALQIYLLAGRSLAAADPSGKWIPVLAERLPSMKNGDAKLFTVNGKKTLQVLWKIKEKARWSDGQPVICADFKLARDIADSENVSVSSKENYTVIEKIAWDKNPKHCTFTYAKPRWDFYRLNFMFPLPSHIEGPIFEKQRTVKEGYEKNSLYSLSPTTLGLHNGPYKMSEVKLGSHIIFEINPYFYGEKPKIDKIIFKVIPNTGTLLSNLQSGTIDSISSLGLTLDQAIAFEKTAISDKLPYTVVFQESGAYDHIDFNMDNPLFKDPKVRQALVMATNREEMSNVFFEGKQKPTAHFLPTNDPWFTKDSKYVKDYPFNFRKASELLDQAGWKIKTGDPYRYKDGKKFSVLFMSTAGNQLRERMQAYLQAAWKKIGVEIIIKNEPARVLFSETMPKRKFEGLVIYANSVVGDFRGSFHSEQIPSESNGWSGSNVAGWKNSKADELIEKINSEFDQKKQADLAHQFIKIYTEEVPAISLFMRVTNSVIPKKLKNFRLSGYSDETMEVENWDLTN